MLQADDRLDEGEFYDVLSNARRRECLRYLLWNDGSVSVTELTRRVAAAESENGAPDESVRKSIYVALRQTHLPKLSELDVVAYDPDRNTVEPGPNLPAFDSLTDGPTSSGRHGPSYLRYLVLGVVALGWIAAIYAGVFLLIL